LADEGDAEHHGPRPALAVALVSFGVLLVCLVAVVLLAKTLTPAVSAAVARLGAPQAVVGIVIAAVVLLPEGLAAVRAAQQNRLQTSMNLALGSALASIGLTIPAVATVSLTLNQPLALGLDGKEEVLLALTLLVGVVTLSTGRTTLMQGAVHLVIMASYLFLSFVP
jgi:Ca2+:H+ antiporter